MKWQFLNRQDSSIFIPEIFLDRKREAQNWLSTKYLWSFLAHRNSNHTNTISNVEFALYGLIKASINIFRSALISFKVEFSIPQDSKFAIAADLTRQHLPPAITLNELEEFFFGHQRVLLNSEVRSLVLIIQTSKRNEQLTERVFASPSFGNLVLGNRASVASRLSLIGNALFRTFTSVKLTRNFLNTLGVLSDIFEMNLFLMGNLHKKIETVFVTNSSFYSYPSIFYLDKSVRQFKTEMLHYSENSLPLTDLEFEEKGLPSWIFNSRVDIHKVWTIEYANFLNSVNPILLVESVGSLIFRPMNIESTGKKSKSVINQILLLDVNPSIFESQNGPYTELAGKSFLDCINRIHPYLISSYEPKPVFKIKSKRRRIPGHSLNYLDQKDQLIARGVFEEVAWDTNLYALIAESDVVLCSVGTSPGLIARELGIPVAIFYGGENKLMDPLVDYGIPILQNPAAVYRFISSNLEKREK